MYKRTRPYIPKIDGKAERVHPNQDLRKGVYPPLSTLAERQAVTHPWLHGLEHCQTTLSPWAEGSVRRSWWKFADVCGVDGGGHRIGWLRWECDALTRTNEDPMTEDRLPLAEMMAEAGDGDFLRFVAEAVVQLLMETDMDGLIGAGRHELICPQSLDRRRLEFPACNHGVGLGAPPGFCNEIGTLLPIDPWGRSSL